MMKRGDRAIGPDGFRHYARARIGGVSARVEGDASRHPVIDLSEGGVRVGGLRLPVGSSVRFALQGQGISARGEGHVAHRGGRATGIAVERWLDTSEPVRSAVLRQLLGELQQSAFISDWG